jgi:hypothetical protein
VANNISKNTIEMRSKFLSLLTEGYSKDEACLRVGLSRHTIDRYCRTDKVFKEAIKRAEAYAQKSLIKDSLNELARGVEKTEETIEYYDSIMIKGEEVKAKRIIKTRKLPPDIKALRMLAYKYAKGEYEDSEKDALGLEIRITSKDRGLSLEERMELVRKDAEAIEIIEDIEVVEVVESSVGGGVPPTEETEEDII